MRNPCFQAALAGACIVSIGLRLPAQSIVVGTVREDSTGRPLAGVGITIEGAKKQAQTDSAGRYAIEAPNGRHVLDFRSPGFRLLRLGVMARGDTVHADATLVPSFATELQAVQVNAPSHVASMGRDGFAARRAMGFGAFIDSTQLRAREERRLADVLRELTKVRFKEYRDPSMSMPELRAISPTKMGTPDTAYPTASGRAIIVLGAPACWVSVFLNGSPIYRSDAIGTGHPPDFNRDFTVSSLESVEYYQGAAEVPAEFGGSNANCGALVLWTRR
ncbi:MAG TPA: carboxypeptidase regulatory-like domain-containing protein [Gemmatimonadaceae bacterium]|nr:carboxypeptidase regulatory-like domain-containing protein [Gemmatimonadaceae bacterium]